MNHKHAALNFSGVFATIRRVPWPVDAGDPQEPPCRATLCPKRSVPGDGGVSAVSLVRFGPTGHDGTVGVTAPMLFTCTFAQDHLPLVLSRMSSRLTPQGFPFRQEMKPGDCTVPAPPQKKHCECTALICTHRLFRSDRTCDAPKGDVSCVDVVGLVA